MDILNIETQIEKLQNARIKQYQDQLKIVEELCIEIEDAPKSNQALILARKILETIDYKLHI